MQLLCLNKNVYAYVHHNRFKKGSDSKVNVEEDCENVAAIETGL